MEEVKNVEVSKPKNVPHFQEAINTILPYLDKYKDVDNLELEFRLGFDEEDGFDTNVNNDFFIKILKTLETNKSWNSKERTRVNDYFHGGKRLTVDYKGGKNCMKKEKLCVLDFEFTDTPFDIRICFSKETPIPISEFNPPSKKIFNREKNRTSYGYKTWVYDITVVKTIENEVEDLSYEVELECNVQESLKRMKPFYFIHSSLLKMKDLINICEKVEDCSILKHINTKVHV
jgi:hypothetical protein